MNSFHFIKKLLILVYPYKPLHLNMWLFIVGARIEWLSPRLDNGHWDLVPNVKPSVSQCISPTGRITRIKVIQHDNLWLFTRNHWRMCTKMHATPFILMTQFTTFLGCLCEKHKKLKFMINGENWYANETWTLTYTMSICQSCDLLVVMWPNSPRELHVNYMSWVSGEEVKY